MHRRGFFKLKVGHMFRSNLHNQEGSRWTHVGCTRSMIFDDFFDVLVHISGYRNLLKWRLLFLIISDCEDLVSLKKKSEKNNGLTRNRFETTKKIA